MIKCQDEIIGADGKFKRFEHMTSKDNKSKDRMTPQNDDAISNNEEEIFSDT